MRVPARVRAHDRDVQHRVVLETDIDERAEVDYVSDDATQEEPHRELLKAHDVAAEDGLAALRARLEARAADEPREHVADPDFADRACRSARRAPLVAERVQ